MCLFTKDVYPSVAKNDIECYKVVKIVCGQPLTPYMNMPIEKDVIDGKNYFCANDTKNAIFNDLYSLNEVRGGYIHTFSSAEEAKQCILYNISTSYLFYYDIASVIFKCIIPKVTEYYSGYCENGNNYNFLYRDRKNMPLNSYASEKIKFVELTVTEAFGY